MTLFPLSPAGYPTKSHPSYPGELLQPSLCSFCRGQPSQTSTTYLCCCTCNTCLIQKTGIGDKHSLSFLQQKEPSPAWLEVCCMQRQGKNTLLFPEIGNKLTTKHISCLMHCRFMSDLFELFSALPTPKHLPLVCMSWIIISQGTSLLFSSLRLLSLFLFCISHTF